MTALEDCIATYQKWLYMPDVGALLVMLAAVVANRTEGDPVWVLFVGPPGYGKTELLNGLTGLPDIHLAATITEPALLSGTPRKDKPSSAKGGLLREIGDFGIIVLKDFGSILSMHRETRAAVLAALREVYDGSWTRHVGVDGGRTLHWDGKIGLIAGCTPTIDGHHSVMASMGERFVLYRLPEVNPSAQAKRALSHSGQEKVMRGELIRDVNRALEQADFRNLKGNAGDDDRLVNIAELAVKCRSAVERDTYNREILLIPGAEAPGRLALVLRRLLNAFRALGVDEEVAWQELTKTALDSIPAIRRAVMVALFPVVDSETSALAVTLGYPTTTTRRTLEDLAAHGLVERASNGAGKADQWELSGWSRNHLVNMNGGFSRNVGDTYISSLNVKEDKSGKVPELTDTLL